MPSKTSAVYLVKPTQTTLKWHRWEVEINFIYAFVEVYVCNEHAPNLRSPAVAFISCTWKMQFQKQKATHPLLVSITGKTESTLFFIWGHAVLFTSMDYTCWIAQPPDKCCNHTYSGLWTSSVIKKSTHWHLVAKEHTANNTKLFICLSFRI